LACAVGRAVIELLADTGPGGVLAAARRLGDGLLAGLADLVGNGVTAVRGSGLWAGVDVDPRLGSGRDVSEDLAGRGVLVKDTHGSTIRLSPPLLVTEDELRFAVDTLAEVLTQRRR
jgi:ornithine--oxo-acid transaminase